MLKIEHVNAGFFSCCTVKLERILSFFRDNKKTPDSIDTTKLFGLYKTNPQQDLDIEFFKRNTRINILYNGDVRVTDLKTEQQFSDYTQLNYRDLKPFIDNYFTPVERIDRIVTELIIKYNINPQNTCGVFYRGTDKCVETNQPSYSEMIQKALHLKAENPGIRFIVQTDEAPFLEEFLRAVPDSFHFQELPKMVKTTQCNLSHVLPPDQRLISTFYYVASLIILGKCNWIITTSGNGEMWMMLFRGHSSNVYQYLNPKEYIYGVKNDSFDPTQTNFWLK